MKKLFSVICLLFISIFLFSGCASVHYSIIMDTTGKIEIGFEIDLDKTAIETAGYNYEQAKDEIFDKVENIISNNRARIISYCINKGKLVSNCGINTDCEYYSEKNVIYAYLKFESREVYKAYNDYLSDGSSGDNEDNTITKEYFLFTKTIETVENPFNDAINQSFVSELLSYFSGGSGKQAFDLDDVKYNCYYGMPTRKLYSNSDYTFSQSGVKIHEWTFDTTEMENDIEFYTFTVKPVAWYLLALILTIIFIGIMAIIILIKRKKNKFIEIKENQENLENPENTIATTEF